MNIDKIMIKMIRVLISCVNVKGNKNDRNNYGRFYSCLVLWIYVGVFVFMLPINCT